MNKKSSLEIFNESVNREYLESLEKRIILPKSKRAGLALFIRMIKDRCATYYNPTFGIPRNYFEKSLNKGLREYGRHILIVKDNWENRKDIL